MNSTQQTAINPWQNRETFPSIDKKQILLSLLALFLCAFGLGCAVVPTVVWIVLVCLFFYTVLVVRSPAPVTVILLTALAGTLLMQSLTGGMLVLCLIVGTASLSWLMSVLNARWLAPAVLLAAFLISFLLSNDAWSAAASFLFMPAGILLYVATVTGQRRTTAICFAEGGFLLSVIAVAALLLYRACGTLDFAVLREYADGGIAYYAGVLANLFEELGKELYQNAIAAGQSEEIAQELLEQTKTYFSEQTFHQILSMLFSLIPAITAVVCGVLAFAAQLFLNMNYRACAWKQVLTPDACIFTMSLPAALLYTIFFVLSMFIPGGTMWASLAENIVLILLPGLCVVGVGVFAATLKRSKGGARVLIILLLAGMICCGGLSSLYFLALWGASAIVMSAFHAFMIRRMAQNGGFDNDRHDDDDKN